MKAAVIPTRISLFKNLQSGYRITAIVFGLILISAAAAKLVSGSGSSTMNWMGMFLTPAAQIALVQIELLLGILLISNWKPRVIRLIAVGFFFCLALTSLVLIYEGQSDCGCFGNIKLNPQSALLIDVLAIALLLVFHPGKFPNVQQNRTDRTDLARVLYRWMAGAGLVVALGSAAAMAIGNVGLEGLLANMRGNRISQVCACFC